MLSLPLLGLAVVGALRPPAVPLVAQDPYTSIWSPHDHLYDGQVMRWNGVLLSSTGLIIVDGQCYTWMGLATEGNVKCKNVVQTSLSVNATKTTYNFAVGSDVALKVSFRTPRKMQTEMTWEEWSLPLTSLTYDVTSSNSHNVTVYVDMGPEITVDNLTNTSVTWGKETAGDYASVKLGNAVQIFGCGVNKIYCEDNNNWGYLRFGYTPAKQETRMGLAQKDIQHAIVNGMAIPDDATPPRKSTDIPVLSLFHSATVTPTQPLSDTFFIGYENAGTMQYYGTLMDGMWLHIHGSYLTAVSFYYQNLAKIDAEHDSFDSKVFSDMANVGGSEYGELGGLAYRQVTAAMVVVWNPVENTPWVFMKEISSDGDVSTVDVIYPAAPFLLYFSPEVLRLLHLPLLEYANNQTSTYGLDKPYNLVWAPHHLGVWPIADIDSQHQEQMPVEETGNILLMVAAMAKLQGGDIKYLDPFWGLINQWGEYLVTVLPDPGDQTCTDDFEGKSPHNSNLAVKGIIALGAYSQLLTLKGDATNAAKYMEIAQAYSVQWVGNATDRDGTHTKLEYDLNGTWSQKYNILFQYYLNLTIIPQSVVDREWVYYRLMANEFGIPLDDRQSFTKVDWSFWIGAMGTDDDFKNVVQMNYKWIQGATQRSVWSDWIWTETPTIKGFRARPVIGGIWAKMVMPK